MGALVTGGGGREGHGHGRRRPRSEVDLRGRDGECARIRRGRRQHRTHLEPALQLARRIRREVADGDGVAGARAGCHRAELERCVGLDLERTGHAARVERRAREERLLAARRLLPVADREPDGHVGGGVGEHVRRVSILGRRGVAEVPVEAQLVEVWICTRARAELHGDSREDDVRSAELCDRWLIGCRYGAEAHAIDVAETLRAASLGDRHGAHLEPQVVHRPSQTEEGRLDRPLLAGGAVRTRDRHEAAGDVVAADPRAEGLRIGAGVEEDDDVDEGVRGRAPAEGR